MTTVIRDLELKISEAHKALAVKEAADAHARLRDEFAVGALTGMLARDVPRAGFEHVAADAYRYADAMMEARNANR